ncbi:MAG: glycosyltransferase family 9 protein [Sphingomonas bacterium]|nr:glycosyltransferase family 9 protein [Sphingomonas bacterium]MDB5688129.1 glycosyltransferase family 9 protein [Sphingomonas bacterium]
MSTLLVSPFSNSDIRDWPAENFSRLIALMLDRPEAPALIRVIGTAGQRQRANGIVRELRSDRVRNDCGTLPWPDVVAEVRTATCVIGNNSGISHLSAYLGTPTVCIFGGSHQRLEWRPQGPAVRLLTRAVGCSPCHLDHGRSCGYAKACLRELAPEVVADAVSELLRGGGGQEHKRAGGI